MFDHTGLKCDTCPKWVQRECKRAYTALGLHSWNVLVEPVGEMPDDMIAYTLTNEEYKNATIHFPVDWKRSTPQRVSILWHEWLHILLAQELDSPLTQLRDSGILPKRHKMWKALHAAYKPSVERLIQALCRALDQLKAING